MPEPEWQQSNTTATCAPLRGHLRNQDGQLLVGEIVSARMAAVGADEPFVLAVGKGLAKRGVRRPLRPVPAELEQRDVTGSGLPRCDRKRSMTLARVASPFFRISTASAAGIDMVCQVVVEQVDVVEASIEGLDVRPVVVDAHEQAHTPCSARTSPSAARAYSTGSTPDYVRNAWRFIAPHPPLPVSACTVPIQPHNAFTCR